MYNTLSDIFCFRLGIRMADGQFKPIYGTSLMLSDTKCETSVNPAKNPHLNNVKTS